jgi:hypothetical protein
LFYATRNARGHEPVGGEIMKQLGLSIVVTIIGLALPAFGQQAVKVVPDGIYVEF